MYKINLYRHESLTLWLSDASQCVWGDEIFRDHDCQWSQYGMYSLWKTCIDFIICFVILYFFLIYTFLTKVNSVIECARLQCIWITNQLLWLCLFFFFFHVICACSINDTRPSSIRGISPSQWWILWMLWVNSLMTPWEVCCLSSIQIHYKLCTLTSVVLLAARAAWL